MTEASARPRERWLDRPAAVSGLVAFRVLFGLLVAASSARFLANGWVERFFVEPAFTFKYLGFGLVAVPPPWAVYAMFAALVVLGLLVAAGLFYRLSAVLLVALFTYLELVDVTNYLNHYYLVSLLGLLVAVLPLHRAGSLDVWRGAVVPVAAFPMWMTALLRGQVALVYLFAALAKVGPDWLLHGQPMGIWLAARGETPLIGPLLGLPGAALTLSWAGFLFDLTIVGWLSWRRTRAYAYGVLVAFHVTVGLLFNIGMFPVIMMVAATVFFSADWPDRALRGLRRRIERRPISAEATVPVAALRPLSRAGLAALVVYALVQVAVPMRQWLYPGDVLWHEQGMRWAWKVMVREKNGAVTYRVRLPDGREREVSPRRYLADYQEREMAGQPDLILQLAHHVARDYDRRGLGPVQVRVDAFVSLNGRRAQMMIDPDVDLTQVSDGLSPASWVLPGPDTPPLRARRIATR